MNLQTKILQHLAAAGACLEVREIAGALDGATAHSVARAGGKLVARGLIIRRRVGCYVISPAGAAAAAAGLEIKSGPRGPQTGRRRRNGGFQARLWRALRAQKKGPLSEFIALAEPGGMRDPVNAAHQYFRALRLAGYVAVLARRMAGSAPTSPGFMVYRLVRDSGPQAPVRIPARGVVHDPNTGETFSVRSQQDE